MFPTLAEIPGGKDRSKTLVFVRGFQGLDNVRFRGSCYGPPPPATTNQAVWYRALRKWGYDGRLLTFRWHSPVSIWLSEKRRVARVEQAAEALCERLSRLAEFDSLNTSLLGFSMGGWIIERVLRIASYNDVQIRRVYLFGAAAPSASPWWNLIECVSDGLWNFFSTREYLLDAWCSDCVGVDGLPGLL
jgi:pimeloyl-ACP methyl ester carboxylesterase